MSITASMVKELRELTSAGMMDCKKALNETNGDMEAAVKYLREQGLMKSEKKSGRITSEGLAAFEIAPCNQAAAVVEVNSETDFVAKNDDFKSFVALCAKTALHSQTSDVEKLKQAKIEGTDETIEQRLQGLIATIGENMSLRRVEYMHVDKGRVCGYLHGAGKIAVLVSLATEAAKDELAELGEDIAMQIASMNPRFISSDDVDEDFIASEKEILMHQAMNEGKPANIAEKMVMGRLQKQLKENCLLEQEFVKNGDFTIKQLIADKAKALGSEIKVEKMVRFEVGEGIEKKCENFAEEVAKQMGK